MPSVVLYFQVHQPYRIKNYSMFAIGQDQDYFQSPEEKLNNQVILSKVAKKCYLPVNQLLYKLLKKHPDFKVTFSISGVALDQFETYTPEVLESFQQLVATGQVELLSETYYHSLAFMFSPEEFTQQVTQHQQKLQQFFNYTPQAFRNTELIYNNQVAVVAEKMGFQAILSEGVDRYLGWRSPNFVYKPVDTKAIKLLLKNYKLSDDIAFRFGDRNWPEWPLTADKFAQWIHNHHEHSDVINLFMDYETFGEHHWQETGILDFLQQLPERVLSYPDNDFKTVSEAVASYEAVDEVNMPELTSWSDVERDLSAWLGNPLQLNAAKAVFELEPAVRASKDPNLLEDWRKLTTSDHYYYMSTKQAADGQVHSYFSPNESPYEAFTNFMNILHDIRYRVYTE